MVHAGDRRAQHLFEGDVGAMVGVQARAEVHGTVLRRRSVEDKAEATDAFVAEVVPMLDDGRVRPVVDTVFPLDAVEDAYALVEADTTFGKVILDARS